MNKNQDLQIVIDSLTEQIEFDKASFAIFHGPGAEESLIEATNDGLKIYALELLKSAQKMDDALDNPDDKIIPFPFEEDWLNENSQTIVTYIRPIKEVHKLSKPEDTKDNTLASKLAPLGCVAFLLLIIAALAIGFWTMMKWVF